MLQRVHPHFSLERRYARVRNDGCSDIVAAYAARGAVGHDPRAAHAVEKATDGANECFSGCTKRTVTAQSHQRGSNHVTCRDVAEASTLARSELDALQALFGEAQVPKWPASLLPRSMPACILHLRARPTWKKAVIIGKVPLPSFIRLLCSFLRPYRCLSCCGA
jgi:hypothetical protein